jgi:type I thyroxine 5'-deiodinase
MPANQKAGINYNQPKTYDERCKVASDCIKNMKLSIPALVDDMKDTAEKAYSGWPDRFFLLGKDGKLVYCGGQGPRGFKPDEVEAELKKLK